MTTINQSKFSFTQLYNAVTECTSFMLVQSKDEEGETIYLLLDGCGDIDGEPFYDLFDVEDYISNNEEVNDYLLSL